MLKTTGLLLVGAGLVFVAATTTNNFEKSVSLQFDEIDKQADSLQYATYAGAEKARKDEQKPKHRHKPTKTMTQQAYPAPSNSSGNYHAGPPPTATKARPHAQQKSSEDHNRSDNGDGSIVCVMQICL